MNNPYKYVDPSGDVAVLVYVAAATVLGAVGGFVDYSLQTYFDEGKQFSGSEALKSTISGAGIGLAVGLTPLALATVAPYVVTVEGGVVLLNIVENLDQSGSLDLIYGQFAKETSKNKVGNDEDKLKDADIKKSPVNENQQPQIPQKQTQQKDNQLLSSGYSGSLFSYDVRRPDDTLIRRTLLSGGGYVDTPIDKDQDKKEKGGKE